MTARRHPLTYDGVGPAWAARSATERCSSAGARRGCWPARRAGACSTSAAAGRPIAPSWRGRRCAVTGVDGARAMVELFRQQRARGRGDPGRHAGAGPRPRFDAILAWDSFFHLSPGDQRAMIAVFAAHAAPARHPDVHLGPGGGRAHGRRRGQTVYHASLAPIALPRHLRAGGSRCSTTGPRTPNATVTRSGWHAAPALRQGDPRLRVDMAARTLD